MDQSSTKYEVRSTKYKVRSTKYQVPSTKYKVQSTKYKVPSTKYQGTSTKYKVRSLHFWKQKKGQHHHHHHHHHHHVHEGLGVFPVDNKDINDSQNTSVFITIYYFRATCFDYNLRVIIRPFNEPFQY